MPHNETGKRYVCTVCGSEVVITRVGPEQKKPLTCHNQPMKLK